MKTSIDWIKSVKQLLVILLALTLFTTSVLPVKAEAEEETAEPEASSDTVIDSDDILSSDNETIDTDDNIVIEENNTIADDNNHDNQSQETEAQDSNIDEQLTAENNNDISEDATLSDELLLDASSQDEETSDGDYSVSLYEGESIVQNPMLSLEEAIIFGDNENLIKNEGMLLTVTGSKGLILLSNVNPQDYCDKSISLVNTEGGFLLWDTKSITYDENKILHFIGLGSTDYPYSGLLSFADNSDAPFTLNRALFNAISVKAQLPASVRFLFDSDYNSTTSLLLADVVKNSETSENFSCNIVLEVPTSGESNVNATIGGILGTVSENVNVNISITNNLSGSLAIVGSSDTGLFCNTMENGSSLTTILDNSKLITVTSNGGNVGGIVGNAENNNTITLSSDYSISEIKTEENTNGDAGSLAGQAKNITFNISDTVQNSTLTISDVTVSSSKGNAGGLIGNATDAITVSNGKISVSETTISAASNMYAGGLAGTYVFSEAKNTIIDLSKFVLNTSISSGKCVGGVFGNLSNFGTEFLELSGNSNTVITSVLSSESDNYGGIVGEYNSNSLSTTLKISDLSVYSDATIAPENYGGIIAYAPDNSYIDINNILPIETKGTAKNNFGGVIAEVGSDDCPVTMNIGSVRITRNGNEVIKNASLLKDKANATVGGLIGYLHNGVLRLHGTTDLSKAVIESRDEGTGQIVGKNGASTEKGGLVYATGTGEDSNWKFLRNCTTPVSDIGNWGEVIRLDGTNLKETTIDTETESPNLFYFDQESHTVTILGNVSNNYTINNIRDFVAYALVFDFSRRTPANIKGIGFTNTSGQNINLKSDVDLTGTGMIGIGRDNGADVVNNCFSGDFEGNNHIVKLDAGSSYGLTIENNSEIKATGVGSGQIYVYQKDWTDSGHGYLGFIAALNGTTKIKNLVLDGVISAMLLGSTSGTRTRVGGVVAYIHGGNGSNINLQNIKIKTDINVNSQNTSLKSSNLGIAAFVGDILQGTRITFDNCEWLKESEITSNYVYNSNNLGGLLAFAQFNTNIEIKNCVLSGSIQATGSNRNTAQVGGLISETQSGTVINISGLQLNGEKIETSSTSSSGGLLGYRWDKTNVTFASDKILTGVTIKGCTLNANSANFGGLVYQATGYWNATNPNSIKFTKTEENISNSFSSTYNQNTSGLLIGTGLGGNDNALYLEVGIWGNVSNSSFKIEENSVNLNINDDAYFDELVGKTIDSKTGHNNAVVSLGVRDANGTTKIDFTEASCNTYTHQLSKQYANGSNIAKNKYGNSRYYYNLDSFRTTIPNNTIGNAEDLVLWSISQYAALNIRGYFCSAPNSEVTITDTIDLTGYSYYPVSPISGVVIRDASLTFAKEIISKAENSAANKTPDNGSYQHYQMQHGLLYDTSSKVELNNVTLAGTVGMDDWGAGAIVFGTVAGNTSSPVSVEFKTVTLNGLRISKDSGNITASDYAPLLMNKNQNGGIDLTVDNISTGDGYVKDDQTIYAATSLFGNIGSANSTNIKVIFSNISLDSRISGEGTSVMNNGTIAVVYNTTHTIFTRATLLESLKYQSDSSGVYNFNSDDTKVTYGYEISNASSGRNPQEQYFYYDVDEYAWDGTGNKPTTNTIASFYSSNYLRYVYVKESGSSHELDINLRVAHLDTGCGTYGHPYEITEGKQLETLAKYLANETINKWIVCIDKRVINSKQQNADNYHSEYESINHAYYMYEGGAWYSVNKGTNDTFTKTNEESFSDSLMRAYLRNAYYQIRNDIVITNSTYMGIGGDTVSGEDAGAFSGVIVGYKKENAISFPTIYISSQIPSALSFGGLIRYSQGSVVKDLNISYAGGTITRPSDNKTITVSKSSVSMNNNSVSRTGNNPFFGGVIGYCMGGDSIVDNVSVSYSNSSVTVSGSYSHLIACGGYVGLVGGGKDSDGNEKAGGGVVFRNMSTTSNNLNSTLEDAVLDANIVDKYGDFTEPQKANPTYFYCNPFIGRVLDGYACYETSDTSQKINNTNKNYIIPSISTSKTYLGVDSNLNIKVNTSEGLWLLSAIVNSGAGMMAGDYAYKEKCDPYNNKSGVEYEVDAYNYGKPRTASYNSIGESVASVDLSDEKFWGGVVTSNPNRVSYLIKEYTTPVKSSDVNIYYASQITGYNTSKNSVVLSFNCSSIDMASYGNGFRGIGSSFGSGQKSWDGTSYLKGRYPFIKSVSGLENKTKIILDINRNDYWDNYPNNGWFVRGTGLFTGISYLDNCSVNNLTISGNVKLMIYNEDGTVKNIEKNATIENYGDIVVGGFAGFTVNSSGTLTFDNFRLEGLTIYGGNHNAGAIGMTELSIGTKTIKFTNWSIGKDTKNAGVSVCKKTDNDGSSGGLIGWCRNGGIEITGYGLNSESWNIDDLVVSSVQTSKNSAAPGGLIGASDGANIVIAGVRGKDLDIYGENVKSVGGLVAIAKSSGSLSITNIYLESITTNAKNSDNTGGIFGRSENSNTFTNVTISGTSSIYCNNGNVGGMIGSVSNIITLNNCRIVGTDAETIKIQSNSNVGGLIGNSGNTVSINNSVLSYVVVLSNSNNASGCLGNINNTVSFSNIIFENLSVISKSRDKSTGLLIGYTNGKNVNGYNILASDCVTGYNASATIDNLGTIQSDGNYNGLWIGDTENNVVKLVAVATKGANLPFKDVGKNVSSAVDIIYADFNVNQSNTTNSTKPWLDINPRSSFSVRDSLSADSVFLTGNGVDYDVSKTILNQASFDYAGNRTYWNVKDNGNNDKTFTKFLDSDNDVYLTKYQTEERNTGTDVPSEVDFPILVVGGLSNADEEIWTYIAALTNVQDGTAAKTQVTEVTANTYKWNQGTGEENSGFVKNTNSSLTIGTDKKTISVTKNAYDNQQSQITILDVKYADPTDNSNAFHLYVPILVKKVLYVRFSAKILAGTSYNSDTYSNLFPDVSKTDYATAGFNEPVTVYIEYNYQRSADDWNAMLASGDYLQWSYDKVLDLAAVEGKTLPKGTRMTLVDAQTGESYTYIWQSEDNTVVDNVKKLNSFNLNNMVAVDGETHFTPASIGSMLGLIADDKTPGNYVIADDGIIEINGMKYRLANDDDGEDKQRYSIMVNRDYIDANGYLKNPEGYYLTLQLPKPGSEGQTVVNNPLRYSSRTLENKESGAPLAYIHNTQLGSGGVVSYVIYDGVRQTGFSVNSYRNGDSAANTVMEDGDYIHVNLTSKIGLTSEGISNFADYPPSELIHQFNLNMKKYVKVDNSNQTINDIVVGAEGATYNYCISIGDNVLYSTAVPISNSEILDSIAIDCLKENYDLVACLKENKNSEITISAEIKLPYPVLGTYFPGRTGDDEISGVSVKADSRVATNVNQLPIASLKAESEEKKRYYTVNPSSANLTFNTYKGPNTEDATRKLGVNPSDAINDLDGLIYANGVYDFSSVDADVLSQASKIKYTLELFVKDSNGNYNGDPLLINEYLSEAKVLEKGDAEIEMDFSERTSEEARYLYFDKDINKTSGTDSINIKFKPLTGNDFEMKGFTYANYKVRLTAMMLDASGNELSGTKATDYIIYTNARVFPQIIK